WDVWSSTTQFPQGIRNQVENAARWIGAAGPGHWPDADMLPIGSLRPVAGWGDARETRLTRDEQRAMLTFWCIVRSPLMMGGNLVSMDDWTLSLLTNDEVLAVDQQATGSRRALEAADVSVWTAREESGAKSYVAVMNLAEVAQTVHRPWADLG